MYHNSKLWSKGDASSRLQYHSSQGHPSEISTNNTAVTATVQGSPRPVQGCRGTRLESACPTQSFSTPDSIAGNQPLPLGKQMLIRCGRYYLRAKLSIQVYKIRHWGKLEYNWMVDILETKQIRIWMNSSIYQVTCPADHVLFSLLIMAIWLYELVAAWTYGDLHC